MTVSTFTKVSFGLPEITSTGRCCHLCVLQTLVYFGRLLLLHSDILSIIMVMMILLHWIIYVSIYLSSMLISPHLKWKSHLNICVLLSAPSLKACWNISKFHCSSLQQKKYILKHALCILWLLILESQMAPGNQRCHLTRPVTATSAGQLVGGHF